MDDFNSNLIADLRAHEGKATSGPFVGRDVVIVTNRGAKSGEPRETPLVYTRDGEAFVIIASKGGAPAHPGWYHNLKAHPRVTLEVGVEKFEAEAREEGGAERDRLFDAMSTLLPGFRDYQANTDRVIPVFTLRRVS